MRGLASFTPASGNAIAAAGQRVAPAAGFDWAFQFPVMTQQGSLAGHVVFICVDAVPDPPDNSAPGSHIVQVSIPSRGP
jgi:hypothetical protein